MNTFDTFTAEVQYRTDRARREVGRNRRKVRMPSLRTQTEGRKR